MARSEDQEFVHLCYWCGEQGTEDNPITQSIISPPVSGYEYVDGWYHNKCATEAAISQVR